MCGILFSTKNNVDSELFKSALNLMHHRGPDATAYKKLTNNIQLGHNRLKIIDLDNRSNQPFIASDGIHYIIYNGEIYNHAELAEKYKLNLITTSDTEVLIELYIKLGENMLNDLNGMFAFVIVNSETGEYFIARDRLGIKPLYLSESQDGLIVSSEISSILNLGVSVEIDKFGLRQYKKLRTFFNGRTIYKNVKMFPAGHYQKNEKLVKYWELPKGKKDAPLDSEVKELIKSSISYRRISDVEVGSYLSGGLDSTIVAGLSDEPHTWTVGFEYSNEFEWSRIAAEKFNSTHHEVLVTDEEFLETAKFMIQKRKEPLSVPNEVMLYLMTKKVKEFNTVVLSGEGADELFFGYDRIFRWANNNENFDIRGFDQHYSYGSNLDDEVIEDALGPFMDRGSTLDIVASFFQISHLHGLLRRVDNSTMLCSVEARVPFVDHRLVELLAGTPFEYRMENSIVKAPLKRIFKDLVPKEIIERKKVGFPVDLKRIFKDYGSDDDSPMDKWLKFNLEVLGVKDA